MDFMFHLLFGSVTALNTLGSVSDSLPTLNKHCTVITHHSLAL